ncbi:MAG: hypothetical protein NTW64_02470 [Candidatus Omnitrophica bacterium]|nr:hypothetical protein [Candidatus Omnitrophota bacterium]
MAAVETVSETSLRPSVIEYTADKLKDPFQGLKVKLKEEPEITKEQAPALDKPLPALRVKGLIWGAIPQAIIENKIYSIGDKIGNFTVLDISNNGVTISFGSERYTLPSPVDEELKKKIEKELKEKKLKEEQDEK